MARVPAWTELRLDAIKLTRLQDQCYDSIHYLLDVTLPDLDRKIMLLNGHQNTQSKQTSPEVLPIQPSRSLVDENIQVKPSSPITLETFNYTTSAFNSVSEFDIHMHEPVQYHSTIIDIPYIKKRERSSPEDTLPAHKSPKHHMMVKSKTVDESLHLTNAVNGFSKSPIRRKEYNLNMYEHLKPLPMPLSEYLRTNRPEVVERADRRASFLRKKAEKRKFLASSRIINYLEQVRLSSRNSNFNSINRFKQRQMKNHIAPEYQVKCRISEQEMKKLTARKYNRLPEVERRRQEEDTKHMKVQNYKNKIEYGRKLLQNRRQGIINYPLRVSYDDRSIASSRDDYLLNDSIRSDDVSYRIESCY